MNQLNLIWELEIQNEAIERYKIELANFNEYTRLKEMTQKSNEVKLSLNLIEEKISMGNQEIRKLERSLKESDYLKKKLENDLYGGSIRGGKQLEQLTHERERTIEKIDNLESSILELLDRLDNLEAEHDNLEREHVLILNEIDNLQEIIEVLVKKHNSKIYKLEEERASLIPQIDRDILARYEASRLKRGKGIVPVIDDVCSGCNVRIPTYLLQDLRKQEEFIYCESCGRLLYYIEKDEKEKIGI